MKRLAIVVQRYGREVAGGAEAHARWVVQRLRKRFDITIFTTTALDYITWEEHYPAGEEELDGVAVRRYPVLERRDLQHFNQYSRWIFNERHRDIDEDLWLRMQGPVCPALIDALRSERKRFDLFFFFTYLYYPTVRGIEQVGERAVILPTAHEEPPIRLRMYQRVFETPIGFLLNTEVERRFLEKTFDLGYRPRVVVGMGIDWPEQAIDPKPVLERHCIRRPYVLSFGRITAGKGHDRIVEVFHRLDLDIDLVLFGKLEIELPNDPRIHSLGFVSDEEKWALISGAELTVHPSRYESLSLALLESWAVGVPSLVNGNCPVLRDHAGRGGGAVTYTNDEEFAEQLLKLAGDRKTRQAMGEAGKIYARTNYEASDVADRYARFLERMIDLRGA